MHAVWYDFIHKIPWPSLPHIDWSAWGHGSLYVVVWIVTCVLILIGFIGTFLPALPGPALIFLGAVFHAAAMTAVVPGVDPGIHWMGFAILLVLLALAIIVDFGSSALGAKYFGASKWGTIGALVGGLVGLFFSIPGLILGPIVGALAFEMYFGKREFKPAAKSSWGTLLGTGAGLVLKGGIGLTMVVYFFVDVWFIKRW
jgi:uncharacterized protein